MSSRISRFSQKIMKISQRFQRIIQKTNNCALDRALDKVSSIFVPDRAVVPINPINSHIKTFMVKRREGKGEGRGKRGICVSLAPQIVYLVLRPCKQTQFYASAKLHHLNSRKQYFHVLLTINKNQGQTFRYSGVDLTLSCFTDGIFYVASSRNGKFFNVGIYGP